MTSAVPVHVARHGPCPQFACPVQILEEKHQLSFHLQQQRLIELIRGGKTEEALEFAQEYLAPRGEENPLFLEELGEYPARGDSSCKDGLHASCLPPMHLTDKACPYSVCTGALAQAVV